MLSAGNPDPRSVFSEDELHELTASHGISISECLGAATELLDAKRFRKGKNWSL